MAKELCSNDEGKLEPFRCKPAENCHHFLFEKAAKLPAPRGTDLPQQPNFFVVLDGDTHNRYIGAKRDNWEQAYILAAHREQAHRILLREDRFAGKIGARIILEVLAAEHLIAQNHGFVFHCSYIDHNGKAILFTAPSGTGKSTQAELWKAYRGARIINGDRAAVRLEEGTLLAEGIPFAGSSAYCENKSLPIEAIVYLGQAPKTTIRKMRGYEAFSKIWEGISVNTWDKKDMELVSAVVKKAAEQIPVYHMSCKPDESAVIALETELRELVNP